MVAIFFSLIKIKPFFITKFILKCFTRFHLSLRTFYLFVEEKTWIKIDMSVWTCRTEIRKKWTRTYEPTFRLCLPKAMFILFLVKPQFHSLTCFKIHLDFLSLSSLMERCILHFCLQPEVFVQPFDIDIRNSAFFVLGFVLCCAAVRNDLDHSTLHSLHFSSNEFD